MQKDILRRITSFITLCLVLAIGTNAQTVPTTGFYYITAQTWNGTKYVERFLYLNGNFVYQTLDVAQASQWAASNPQNGSGIALSTGGKYLMRGGITSTNWGSIVAEPTVTTSEPPQGSLTIKSTVTNYQYYVIAPNAGTVFTNVNAPNEDSYQPKTSLYTPYFKFYKSNFPVVCVVEKLSDGTPKELGATYMLIRDGHPEPGNVWYIRPNCYITIDNESYNKEIYTFEGFRVGASDELVKTISTNTFTSDKTTVTAVFTSKDITGEKFTFISSFPEWYKNQQKYKAIYLDTNDNKLKWKDYDPAEDAFYFVAHGSLDNLTLESLAKPGYYITGANTDVSATGKKVELRPLSAGDYNIVSNNQIFATYNANNGRNASGTIVNQSANNGSGTIASWWVQSANDKNAEAERYQQALEGERHKKARAQLLQAINSVVVGDNMGNVPADAYALAVGTYENTSLGPDDYTNAITLLYSSCNVPPVGTKWRIINNANSNQLITVGINDGLYSKFRLASLYQIWEVESIHFDQPDNSNVGEEGAVRQDYSNQLAFRNLGSETYLCCNTMSSNAPTITSDDRSYLNLNSITPGVFSLEVLNRADQYIYLSPSDSGNGYAIIVNNSGLWRFEEVTESELAQLSQEEVTRQAKRQELLDLIEGAKTLSTTAGGIGYYTNLATPIANAQTKYADASSLTSEYQSAITTLETAIRNAQYIQPNSEATYIVCDPEGRIAMKYTDNASTLESFVDTNVNFFWKLTPVTMTDDNVLPWNQQYTLTSIDGNNTVLNVTLQLIGNDEYYITIDGDQGWNTSNTQNPLSIHKASFGVDYSYLTDGETYRIRNLVNNKVLTRSEIWTSRVSVETADNTLTDYNQLWRVEKLPGADRYTFQDCEVNRYIEEQLQAGSQLDAAFNPGIWHLQATGQDGQYQILTTMAAMDQLAVAYNGDKAVAAAQNAAGTTWVFERVTPVEKPDPNRQVYKIINRFKDTNNQNKVEKNYLYATYSSVEHSCGKNANFYNNELFQKFILNERDSVASDGTPVLDSNNNRIRLVSIQSRQYSTYVAPQNKANPFTVSIQPYFYQLLEYTDGATGQTYLVFKDQKANQYLAVNTNVSTYNRLAWTTNINSTNAHWSLEEVEGEIINDEVLLDRNDATGWYCKPEDGVVVRIETMGETYLDEYYKTNTLQHKALNDKRYAQLWRLHLNPETGFYKIENIYSGNYLCKPTVASNAVSTTTDESKAGEFAIVRNSNITATRRYNILDPTLGLGLSAASGNITADGTPTDKDEVTTSEFRFLKAKTSEHVLYTEEDYAAMRQKFIESRDLLLYVDKYDGILQTLFSDRACTTIKPELTDEEIEEILDNLPEMLVDMANKIRNNEWPTYSTGNNWDKTFRIREYPVVSHPNWGGALRMAYNFSWLNEPVGIMARPGDVLAIMVDEAPKAGATLALQFVEGYRLSGNTIALKQGLNLIQVSEDVNLFINYVITSTGNSPANYLSNFPPIKIHIEGGEVYGCINRVHGPGTGTAAEADKVWTDMLKDGLIRNGNLVQIVGESIMLNFNGWNTADACPSKIGEVIDAWDNIIKTQQWLMGLRDREGNIINDYYPNLKERWNNRWGAFERTGGYMNANAGGAQYNSGCIPGLVNYNTLSTSAPWGICHEHGHDHQTVINMCGMTEVSNNLFSNVNSREFGAVVSRGSSLPDAASVFARGGHWYDNNIWVMTQMYYKLYLYYHVAGNKPTFYPEVFAKLRASGLKNNASIAVPADQDYLKFAKVCSEVAGEDLSEFFEAYGMLRPLTPEYSLRGEAAFEDYKGIKCRIVSDYNTYHMYSTDKMIADAKAFMQAQGPKNGSIIFIDDRIRKEQAAFPGAKPGQMRSGRGDGGTIGAFGNVGMWDEFTPECHKTYARNYTMTKEWGANGITVHISGQGAVGYKVYGPEGELVYFSAFNDFQIPSVIFNKYDFDQLAIVAAQADGTSVEITTSEDAKFTVTTYRDGNSEGIATTSTGLFNPELRANDVCVVEPIAGVSLDGFKHPETANVILKGETESSMQLLSLQDLTNFYIPEDVDVVETALYQRPNTTGWNSLCLPVAVTEDDFGPDTKIYTVKSVEEEGEKVIYLIRKPSVEAGEPCFVLCGDESSDWDLSITGSKAAAEIQPATSKDGSVQINGSYTSQTIGAGKYKLNGDGTKFGITKADTSTIAAFRSYIETPVSGPTVFRVRLIENPTGIDDPVIDRVMENGKIYDLSGRQIPAPLQGQPYILNGKVYYNR